MNFLISAALVLCYFHNIVDSVEISTKYPDGKDHFLAEFGRKLQLECTVRDIDGKEYMMSWFKDNAMLSHLSASEHNWYTIENANVTDAGNYECRLHNKDAKPDTNPIRSASLRVKFKPIVWITEKDRPVVEGSNFTILCKSLGNVQNIKWTFSNDSKNSQEFTESRGRIHLSNGDVKNSVLSVDNATKADRGNYTCVGVVEDDFKDKGPFVGFTYVRVKGKYAALWPFIGIVAEVLVLSLIIVIYEQKRDKTELEESDTDNGPETNSSSDRTNNDGIRQRK